MVDGQAGTAVPEHRGFTLVGDAHGVNVACVEPSLCHSSARGGQLGAPDRHRVMLNPSGLREDLRQLLLRQRVNVPPFVENDAA